METPGSARDDDRPSPPQAGPAAGAMDATPTGPRGPANHHDPENGSGLMTTTAASSLVKSSDASVEPAAPHRTHDDDEHIEVLSVTDATTLNGDNDNDDNKSDANTISVDLATTTTLTGGPATTTTGGGGDSSAATPLWWTTRPTTRHTRSTSTASQLTIPRRGAGATAIALEDHSEDDSSQSRSYSCWARSVTVDAHHVVSGNSPLPALSFHHPSSSSSSTAAAGPLPIGAYVVWHCTIRTLAGGELALRKRYSEFDALRADLVRCFPHAANMIPPLPRKSVVSRFRPRFLELRRVGLDHFLNCVLLNPEFAAAPVVKEFVFS